MLLKNLHFWDIREEVLLKANLLISALGSEKV